MQAVSQTGHALPFASKAFLDDRELVKMAVAQNSSALLCVSDELRSDRELWLCAASDRHDKWSTKDSVLEEVAKEASRLQFASDELRTDHDLLMSAALQDISLVQF